MEKKDSLKDECLIDCYRNNWAQNCRFSFLWAFFRGVPLHTMQGDNPLDPCKKKCAEKHPNQFGSGVILYNQDFLIFFS